MGPKPPDPAQTAQQAQQINQQTAQQQFQLGATNQVTPGGSLTYEQVGTWPDGTPKYQATQALSGQNQGVYNNLMSAANTAAGNISNPINVPQLTNDFSADRLRVEDALFARLNPQMEAARTSRETDLFNRGVRPGTAAYDRGMNLVGQQENDARLQTVLAGGQEQSRMFRDQLDGATGMFGMNLAARSQPINEISSLMSGSQVNQPGYVPTPQPGVAGVDYAGLVNNQYEQQQQRRQNILSGLFGLGGSIFGAAGSAGGFGALFSDERLKEDIRRVGETDAGQPVYTYRYKGDDKTHMGVMAQESPRDAVSVHSSGYLTVDYTRIR